MSIKKKLGLGAASAALGLSLVVGGTWAAFNDTATVNNHFAAGTLDLEVGKSATKPISFDLSNMKPGDSVQRIFKLNNKGTLAIKEVLLNTIAENFVDGNKIVRDSKQEEFLSQFVVDFIQVSDESNRNFPMVGITKSGQTLTLADLVDGSFLAKVKPEYLGTGGKINLASLTVDNNAYRGMPSGDSDDVFIQITFKNDLTKNDKNEYVQNKYQGDTIDFFFNLEATQWDGVDVDTPNGNGAINNGVQTEKETINGKVVQKTPDYRDRTVSVPAPKFSDAVND